MDFTVVIPAFNEGRYLPATLAALGEAMDGSGRSGGGPTVRLDQTTPKAERLLRT